LLNMSNSKPVFGYHDLRGIAYPIKLQLAYLGLDYVDKRYPLTPEGIAEWGSVKPNLGLDFPNLPYWKDEGTGVHLTESRAILKYIAREHGGDLMPKCNKWVAQAEIVESVLWDTWFFLIWRCFHDNEVFIKFLEERAPSKFQQLEKYLEGNAWVLGKKISYVDFMLYEVLHGYKTYDAKWLAPYPNLIKFMADFEAVPNIKKFLESPENIKGPCFHPMFMSKFKVAGLTC